MIHRSASLGSETLSSLETKRQAINNLFRANGGVDFTLVNLAVHPELEDSTNLTYFVDGVHLTDAGYAIVAQDVAAAILGLS
jgi:lysophospholipase L1-like esterase